MSAYPIAYEQFPPSKRSRLTVVFRFVLALPHFIWTTFYLYLVTDRYRSVSDREPPPLGSPVASCR